MRFGVALDMAPMGQQTYAHRIDALDPVIDACSAHDFGALSIGESYSFSSSDPMGFHSPNALIMLGALAGRLRDIRLVAGVTLLAGWSQLRLAYDAALVDQISNGRLTLGIGLGSRQAWRAFGGEAIDRGRHLEETVAALRSAWRGSFDRGTARFEALPKPVQRGGPPLLIGGARQVSAERAALLGDGFVASSGYDLDLVSRQARHYWAALNGATGSVSVNRFLVVSERRRTAFELYDKYVAPVVAAYQKVVPVKSESDRSSSSRCPRDVMCLVGTPEDVTERVHWYAECGVTDIQLRVAPWGLSSADAVASLELFASAVRPKFE